MMVAAFPSPSASGAPDDIDYGGLLDPETPSDAVALRADGAFEAMELWSGTAAVTGRLRDVGANVKTDETLGDDGNYQRHDQSSLLQLDV
eukprot:11459047-Heterocapsa_arctica.AAC.1